MEANLGTELAVGLLWGESLLLLGDGKLDGESQGCGVQSCKNEVNSGSFGEREDGNTKSSIPGE
jgi:hypothetical protein